MARTLHLMIVVIIGVCVYDIYLTSAERLHLLYTELNPVGKLLITKKHHAFRIVTGPDKATATLRIEDYDVSKLIAVKVTGLILAQYLLTWILTNIRKTMACVIISTIFVMQCALLYILTN